MIKRIIIPVLSFFILFSQSVNGQKTHGESDTIIEISKDTIHEHSKSDTLHIVKHKETVIVGEKNHSDSEHEGEGHGGMEPLFFIIIALLIGAATRHFFRKIPLPFTVLLLIFGIILGLLNRFDLFAGWAETFSKSLEWAGHIDPHAILFIFLPILIFEAAYAMDLHTFKKTVINSVILAVPGIILALILSAGLAILLKVLNVGLLSWEWNIALMFGAVISATDPVAVVALLKELGAGKKLGTLIEGESLLNDGTAIVIFMVFFTAITGTSSDLNSVAEFGKVAFGGILIGIIIAGIVMVWVKRVFNDVLVEISVIIAAAYMAFFVAEHFLHMSGVLALVSLGLVMAGVGKTRISPKVEHFLHEFWELAAFLANVLIFIIVGVVIAQRTEFSLNDFLILGIFYIGLHLIRGIIIILFYPLMKKFGYGLNKKEATVLWYGALRGAIGLALALVVVNVDDKYISYEVKNQFFFITAGIVTLTLLINATTIGFIVRSLGLTKLAPAKLLMIIKAKQYLRSSTENSLDRLKRDRFISNADWGLVNEYLPENVTGEDILEIDMISEMRKRILEKEKSSYWHQFKEGMLGATAVRRLSEGIDEILDEGGLKSLSERKDLELLLNTPKLLSKLQSVPLLKRLTRRLFFERLYVSYDCARGFYEAQHESIKLVESIHRSLEKDDKQGNKNLELIEEEINENKIEGLTFIRNLRKTYPEIYDAISTRQATRSLLNYEIKTIERLQKNGRIDSTEAHKMVHSVEERMKKLLLTPPEVKIPDAAFLLKEIPLFQDFDDISKDKIGKAFNAKIHAVGDTIIKEGSASDHMYIVARGTVKIEMKDDLIEILGKGSIIGEMGVLTGAQRNASVITESPSTVFVINSTNLKKLFKEFPKFEDALWSVVGERTAGNILSVQEPYCLMRPKKLKKFLTTGDLISIEDKSEFDLEEKTGVLIHGKLLVPGGRSKITAPALIQVHNFSAVGNAKIFVLSKEE